MYSLVQNAPKCDDYSFIYWKSQLHLNLSHGNSNFYVQYCFCVGSYYELLLYCPMYKFEEYFASRFTWICFVYLFMFIVIHFRD